jgi:hypothetical protein
VVECEVAAWYSHAAAKRRANIMKISLHHLSFVCAAGRDKMAEAVKDGYPSAASKGDSVSPLLIMA